MRLVLSETYMADAPTFELPKNVVAATYFHTSYGNGYGSVSLTGISPAQLHDIIGCTAKQDYEAAVDGWICEAHPEKGWPHDDCIGPGMPETNRVRAIVLQRDRYRAAFLALKDAAEEAYDQSHAGAKFRDQIRDAVAIATGESEPHACERLGEDPNTP